MKDLTRVGFVCGGRALRAARSDFAVMTESARQFSGAFEDLPRLIAKQAEELRESAKSRERLLKRLADYAARELWNGAAEAGGRKVIRQTFSSGEAEEARNLAHALAKLPGTVALIGVEGKQAMLFFAQSPGGPADMGAILRQTLAKVGGKGGGSRDFAQGGGTESSSLKDTLDIAASLL